MTMSDQLVDPAALFPAKYFQTRRYFGMPETASGIW